MFKNFSILILTFSLIFSNSANLSFFNFNNSKINSKLSFAVFSDVHIKDKYTEANKKFKKALLTYNKISPNLDAYIIVGDLTDNGSSLQYDNLMTIYNKYSNKNAKLFAVMGNHDYWNGLNAIDAQNLFEEKIGVKIHSHEVLKGYHFINLSTENDEIHGTFSDSSIHWLKEELIKASKDNPNNPIFINVHHPIKGTVYGSDLWGNPTLDMVLKQFPQVIVFSGHSHYDINDERSINQRDYTCIGTSSLCYTELEPGKIQGSVPPNAFKFSQGLLVKVLEDTSVEIQRLDFYNNSIIKTSWIIKEPSNKNNFIYLDTRKNLTPNPYFNEKSKIKVNNIKSNKATISFDIAAHEDFVHSYRIEILNKDTNTLENIFAFSDFYLGLKNMSKNLTFTIPNLTTNTNYEIKVYAIESFGKESLNFLKSNFKTL